MIDKSSVFFSYEICNFPLQIALDLFECNHDNANMSDEILSFRINLHLTLAKRESSGMIFVELFVVRLSPCIKKNKQNSKVSLRLFEHHVLLDFLKNSDEDDLWFAYCSSNNKIIYCLVYSTMFTFLPK